MNETQKHLAAIVDTSCRCAVDKAVLLDSLGRLLGKISAEDLRWAWDRFLSQSDHTSPTTDHVVRYFGSELFDPC